MKLLTEILIDAQNVEDSQIPVNAVDTINHSSVIHHIGPKTQTHADNEGQDRNAITRIPHVPRPDGKLVAVGVEERNFRDFKSSQLLHKTHQIATGSDERISRTFSKPNVAM